jgi:hypothetical protein
MLCGRFVIAPPHDRLLRRYLPPRLVVHVGDDNLKMARSGPPHSSLVWSR